LACGAGLEPATRWGHEIQRLAASTDIAIRNAACRSRTEPGEVESPATSHEVERCMEALDGFRPRDRPLTRRVLCWLSYKSERAA
jgi:hypothetical protein